MNILSMGVAILIALTASKAASATVEYTYTTNGYDLSHWEDWELAWIEKEYSYGHLLMGAALPRKMFSFQAECQPGAPCTFFTGGLDIRKTTINNLNTLSSVMEITRTYAGFIDSFSMSGGFVADFSSRDIQGWEIQGGEYNAVGDYRLTTAGDTYDFAPDISTYFFSPQAYYCHYTYGDALAYPNTSPTVCAGGQDAKFINTSPISLGQGTWASQQISPVPLPGSLPTSQQISPIPLPGSLPLLGLGFLLLGYVKMRKT